MYMKVANFHNRETTHVSTSLQIGTLRTMKSDYFTIPPEVIVQTDLFDEFFIKSLTILGWSV